MELTQRQQQQRDRIARFTKVRRLLAELNVMNAAIFDNWGRRGVLRPAEIGGRERFATRPPRGAWELFQWLTAALARGFNAVQVPAALLAAYCDCSADQLRDVAIPWLVANHLVAVEPYFDRATTRRRQLYRRDGSRGTWQQRANVLMLDYGGDALLAKRAAATKAANALRAFRKKSDPNDSAFSVEKADPYTTSKLCNTRRPRGEGAPAAPAPSTVHVEALRRTFPSELAHVQRFRRGKVRPLRGRVDRHKARGPRRGEAAAPPAAPECSASGAQRPVGTTSPTPAAAPTSAPSTQPRGNGSGGGGGDDGPDPRELMRLTLAAMRGDVDARKRLTAIAAEFGQETIRPAVAQLAECAQAAIVNRDESPNGDVLTGAHSSSRPGRIVSKSTPAPAYVNHYADCASDADEEAREAAIRRSNVDRVGEPSRFTWGRR